MSRFLTPAKACLLVLIEVYCEGHIASEATVSFLSFIVSNVIPSKRSASPATPSPLSLKDFESKLSSLQSSTPGRTIWDFFLVKIWSIDCADSLHAFFDDLSGLLYKPKRRPDEEEDEEEEEEQREGIKLTRSSPLGIFVRRAEVEFTRLNFQHAVELWRSFLVYREPSYGIWAKRSRDVGSRTVVDVNLLQMADMRVQDITYGDLPDPSSMEATHSTEDIERLLDHCVADMSRSGNRLSDSVREKMAEFATDHNGTVPSTSHYVYFLDAWKAGDYPAALDSLHRYFDYTIQVKGRLHYQYALLNMALLHAHFGAYSEAISAMQETVATARENKDTGCLNYSLSWLFHFGITHPQASSEIQKSGVLGCGKEALTFLQSKAREAGSWSLLSTTLVSDARMTMLQGDGLSGAVENLVRASHLNLTKHIPAAVGSVMAMESALWSRAGVAELVETKDHIFLECYRARAPDVDAVNAICRIAAALAERGQYGSAMTAMADVPQEALKTSSTHAIWSVNLGLLKLQHAIYRQDYLGAEQFLHQLRAMTETKTTSTSSFEAKDGRGAEFGSSVMAATEPSKEFDVSYLHIRLLIARDELDKAFDMLDNTSLALDLANADIYHRTRFMLLKAELWARTNQPARGFSIVLRASSIAHSARLIPLLWHGMTLLSSILATLGEYNAARQLLESITPRLLANRVREANARAYATLADVHVGMAGKVGRQPGREGAAKRKEEIGKALDYLGRTFDEYSAIGDVSGQCEALAKRAMLMHISGDSQLAIDVAAKYKDIAESTREDLKA